MRKGKYYILPLNASNQPSGYIEEIYLTKAEYEEMNRKGKYVFKKYESALIWSQQ